MNSRASNLRAVSVAHQTSQPKLPGKKTAPVGAVIVAENRSEFWRPLDVPQMRYAEIWDAKREAYGSPRFEIAYNSEADANGRHRRGQGHRVESASNFKGLVRLGDLDNGVQFQRLDVHGVLFRSMLVWFLGTLGGVHGSNCEGIAGSGKSPLTGVCFRGDSGQNRAASLLSTRNRSAPQWTRSDARLDALEQELRRNIASPPADLPAFWTIGSSAFALFHSQRVRSVASRS